MADAFIIFLCILIAAFGLFVLIAALAARLAGNARLLRIAAPMMIRNIDPGGMDDAEFIRRYALPLLAVGAGLTVLGALFIYLGVNGFRLFHF